MAKVPSGVNAAKVLRELAVRYRECWTYGVDGLVGATPEMLIQVEGRTAQARVLAGTLDRRDEHGEFVVAVPEHRFEDLGRSRTVGTDRELEDAVLAHGNPLALELPEVWEDLLRRRSRALAREMAADEQEHVQLIERMLESKPDRRVQWEGLYEV